MEPHEPPSLSYGFGDAHGLRMEDLQDGEGKRGAKQDETAQDRVISDRYVIEDYAAPRIVFCQLCHASSPFYRVSGRSVRAASTTCSIAALGTCTSPSSYNSDTCVAPSTTRWMLLGESAASSSCISSQLDGCSAALTTASGFSPRLPASRTCAVVSGVARNSSTVVTTCCVEELKASICARWCDGKSGGAGTELDRR